jgi:formylglycine-generating enzyme required for sulfatase activity
LPGWLNVNPQLMRECRLHLGALSRLGWAGLLVALVVQAAACISVERRPAAWGASAAPTMADACQPIQGVYRNVGESAGGDRVFLAEQIHFFQQSDGPSSPDAMIELADDMAAAETVSLSLTDESPLQIAIHGEGISRFSIVERWRFKCRDGVLSIGSTGPTGDEIFVGIGSGAVELQRVGDYLLIHQHGSFAAVPVLPVLPLPLAGHGSFWLRFEKAAEPPSTPELDSRQESVTEQQTDRIANMVDALRRQMVSIPAGSFRMGGTSSFEKPVHEVQVSAFRLSAHEVTFEQYDLFATSTGRELPADPGWGRRPRKPVMNLSWADAQAFIAWLNEQSGLRFRLPSEAEWEYAARAGTTTPYPWGKKFRNDMANGESRAGSGPDLWTSTAPVGAFPPNAWGLYDMVGNVWEWTEDCLNFTYAGAPADGSAWLSGDCNQRIVRGGSWRQFAWGPFGSSSYVPVHKRYWRTTTERNTTLGFRLAQDP